MQETLEQKNLMLDMAGEPYEVITNPPTVPPIILRLVPGKDSNMVSDFHNPYDAERERFKLITTEEEVKSASLTYDMLLRSVNYNRMFKIINISPDETGWAVIQVSWEDRNI